MPYWRRSRQEEDGGRRRSHLRGFLTSSGPESSMRLRCKGWNTSNLAVSVTSARAVSEDKLVAMEVLKSPLFDSWVSGAERTVVGGRSSGGAGGGAASVSAGHRRQCGPATGVQVCSAGPPAGISDTRAPEGARGRRSRVLRVQVCLAALSPFGSGFPSSPLKW